MTATTRRAGRLATLGALAAVLAVVSTLTVAAGSGAFRSSRVAPDGSCTAPPLAGTLVTVRLMNMGGGMMASGPMGGTMRLVADRSTVPAGIVSFLVGNVGNLDHELVVLPLPAGAVAGQRTVSGANRVDEAGSVGEASRACGEGAGDGITPGGIGWVTLTLPAGDYELICNLSGHYAAGMHTALHVS